MNDEAFAAAEQAGSRIVAIRGRAVKLRAAAAMIVVDHSGAQPKVLLGRRHAALSFLPGKYVFPGGRLEACDRAMCASGSLPDKCRERLALRRPQHFAGADATALAGIRELFEETGLLVGKRRNNADPPGPPAWRRFADLGFTPNLAPLRFFARAVTPSGFPRRYDTSFFVVDAAAIAHHIEGCVGEHSELVELTWLPFAEARNCESPSITHMILSELETHISANFADHLPVPFFYQRKRRWIREEL